MSYARRYFYLFLRIFTLYTFVQSAYMSYFTYFLDCFDAELIASTVDFRSWTQQKHVYVCCLALFDNFTLIYSEIRELRALYTHATCIFVTLLFRPLLTFNAGMIASTADFRSKNVIETCIRLLSRVILIMVAVTHVYSRATSTFHTNSHLQHVV